MNNYKIIKIYHAIDPTTMFLKPLEHLGESYSPFDQDTPNYFIQDVKNFDENSLIIFAGHGFSDGLYRPSDVRRDDENYLMMDAIQANICFKDHDVILLACRSEQFIRKLSTFNKIIGFGNIISSQDEIVTYNSKNSEKIIMSDEDLDIFNQSYTDSFCKVISLVQSHRIDFLEIPLYINYFINKKINSILKNKGLNNRREIARQLFRFRNEMRLLKGA
ncbi:hypothetical protein [Sphingobacterium mizutaii]|uniref:hypothetical protein n=1 Tax=Sphingobacterium mizutaii TaxID=1010 RepID=UPI00162795AC|nr:hypothetical protein [Sphingobacterium mizutaii]